MATKMKDMTCGRPVGLIITFALPLMLGNIFQQLYMVVDTMVVGKALGVGALAALGAVDWLNWMMLGLTQGVMQGFAIPMAQSFGARNEKELRRVVGCAMVLSVLCAIGFVAVGQGIARPVLQLLRTPDEIMDSALMYQRILFAGLPIVVAYNLFASILRALGDSQTPLHAMMVASVINIVLDLFFVLVCKWGIAGAAIATVIAQLFSSLFCLVYILKNPVLKLRKSDFALPKDLVARLFRMGTPMGVQNIMIAVGGMIIQSMVNDFGVAFIAGYTAANKLYGILEIASTSYGYAMITYVGQNLGAGRFDRIRSGFKAAMGVAMVTSLCIGGAMVLFGRTILGWFVSGDPAEVAVTLQSGYTYLAIMSISLPALYVLYVSRSSTQGMGNTVLPMVSGIVELGIRTLCAVLLTRSIGENGVFYAEVLAWFGSCVVLLPSYFTTLRRREEEWKLYNG